MVNISFDATWAENVKAALDKAIAAFARLDVAFNNAGSEQPMAATGDLAGA